MTRILLKSLCLIMILSALSLGTQALAHDQGTLKFEPTTLPDAATDRPRCLVRENIDFIVSTIEDLENQGFENVEHQGEGQFCYTDSRSDDRNPQVSCTGIVDAELWVLSKDEEFVASFRTQTEAFIEAAYLHAGKNCIFPFTFYLQRK